MTITNTASQHTPNTLMDNPTNNRSNPQADAFLQQLQHTLLTLAKPAQPVADKQIPILTSALQQWIAALYHARHNGDGYLNIHDIGTRQLPSISELQAIFPALISTASDDNLTAPIVIFDRFVAFRRDYLLFQQIADYLQRPQQLLPLDPKLLETIVTDSKPPTVHNAVNDTVHKKLSPFWALSATTRLHHQQQLAAVAAASLPFCIISGGAGTGKTTTLAKALELILLHQPDCHILLAAPTGKAAHRLNESLQQQLTAVSDKVRPALAAIKAHTLHRLLGIGKHGSRPFYHADNPLHCDVLAVDEASMVGSDLFILLQQALLPHSRLILLGDARQLPAINGVAVFNDIAALPVHYSEDFCQLVNPLLDTPIQPQHNNSQPTHGLCNSLCVLSAPQRFSQTSVVQQAADAVLHHQGDNLLACLGEQFQVISTLARDWRQQLAMTYPGEIQPLLTALKQRIVLCANRHGPFGSEALNDYLDHYFRRCLQTHQRWYQGRRVMIRQNNYRLNLFNGDIGYCEIIQQQPVLIFDNDRRYRVDALHEYLYELAFAISIHKSQGSEYHHVDIITGSYHTKTTDTPYGLLTASLLYTAITRAKHSLTLYGEADLIRQALLAPTSNISPLSVLFNRQNEQQ